MLELATSLRSPHKRRKLESSERRFKEARKIAQSRSRLSQINNFFSGASTVYCVVLLWFHHRLIIVAQIGEYTFVATRMLIDADTLSMPQQSFVKIIDAACILGQQCLEQFVRIISCYLLANEAQSS